MTIAIDYDGTWTRDPGAWNEFCHLMHDRDHDLYIATGRKAWSEDIERGRIPGFVDIIYCGPELKEAVMRRNGIKVDVWIDDMPGTIQDCKIIGGEL